MADSEPGILAEPLAFDRREGDVNVQALAVRMTSFEGDMKSLRFDVQDQGRKLAEQGRKLDEIHEKMPGLAETVERINAVTDLFDGMGQWIARWGGRLGRASDAISLFIRRFWWVLIVISGVIGYVKTGKLPELPIFPQ